MRKEFPFLNDVAALFTWPSIGLEDVDEVKIRRGDSSLMRKKGNSNSYSSSAGGFDEYTTYVAIWTDSEGVIQAKLLKNAGHSASGSGENNEWDADPIGDQLYALGITPDFIVECDKEDTDCNGNGRVYYSWTIYKMSKFDLLTYHQTQIDQAAAELKAEIAAACA